MGAPTLLFLSTVCFASALSGASKSRSTPAPAPSFSSTGETYDALAGSTAYLPCKVINRGPYLVVWRKGPVVLTAGDVKVSPDPRYKLASDYTLEIREVNLSDAGQYYCQIGTLTPQEVGHTLKVLEASRIVRIPTGTRMEVKQGKPVTMECQVSGNPKPSVTWARKNNDMPDDNIVADGTRLTISSVTHQHAGTYTCSAFNGVGKPDLQEIELHVLFIPKVEMERSWVHSGEGYEAQLVCIVHAEPSAEVTWYRNTLRLDNTERYLVEARGSRYSISIRKVHDSDFGNYTCVADNGIGKDRKTITLSGNPHRSEFLSLPTSRSPSVYNISWSTNSYTPLEEFRLFYREAPGPEDRDSNTQPPKPPKPGTTSTLAYQRGNDRRRTVLKDNEPQIIHVPFPWKEITIPAQPSELFNTKTSYLITDLEGGTRYEAVVYSRNRFGWSEASSNLEFTTHHGDEPSSTVKPTESAREVKLRGGSCRAQLDLAVVLAFLAALLRLCGRCSTA